ncbi:glycosyl transferase group 1 [Hyphomicrobium denitrificans ATCC 51888]|uniref:Glycosyl transferase group 1 n=1 Tax=Hyphomicrobium denitrificans (strain ATCC 51888 / DSM 1869 / NCIMB 11706 / TK 0415) TaxID=582899 RepID=D8JQ88_HYPDA|nr:glycosyltransferase [Hyphomicrobium denitrificans]ADJ22009.1 glycosyl transferase group 1 [Hyphomicrobium denitrificans ATCC 51888]
MSRILLVCVKFSTDAANGWLTNDLVDAFVRAGHSVDVIHLEWQEEHSVEFVTMANGARLLRLSALSFFPSWLPNIVRKGAKWLIASYLAARAAQKFIPPQAYDLVVGFSPAVVTDGLVKCYQQQAKKTLLLYWDFFPLAQYQLGLLPGGKIAAVVAHSFESKAVGRYSQVGCMTPANIRLFRSYFPKYSGRMMQVLPWGPAGLIDLSHRDEIRNRFAFSAGDVVCVFGGQLIPGREIERIGELAQRVSETLPTVRFAIAGSGPLAGLIEQQAANLPNLTFLGKLSRSRYCELLAAADIGIVLTSADFKVPNFPSKTVDYFRAQLPILGAVETFGDYTSIINEEIKAGLSCSVEDAAQLEKNLRVLVSDAAYRTECGRRGADYYLNHMSASNVVLRVAGDETCY